MEAALARDVERVQSDVAGTIAVQLLTPTGLRELDVAPSAGVHDSVRAALQLPGEPSPPLRGDPHLPALR